MLLKLWYLQEISYRTVKFSDYLSIFYKDARKLVDVDFSLDKTYRLYESYVKNLQVFLR